MTSPRRTRLTAGLLWGVVGGMLGLSFAAVPLYRLYCQATGYEGTPKTEGVVRSDHVTDAVVTVRFDANVNSALPWRFVPAQREVRVRLGEETLVHYTAKNTSDKPITGTATFNVVPDKAARYFNKLECFCFTEQTLAPGEEVSMPVVFFVDPALAEDIDAKDATTLTLSYTFYRANAVTEGQGTGTKVVARTSQGAGG